MRRYTYKDYCPKRFTEIENYELAKADNFKGWICHHKLGETCFTKDELKKFDLYFDVTPGELIFLTRAEHMRLHMKGNDYGKYAKGKVCSDEAKQKMSKAIKGRHWYTNGVECVQSFTCPDGFHLGRK